MRPYIGITGFMSGEEVAAALRIFREKKENIRNFAGAEIIQHKPDYMLMIGVLASLKTFYGMTHNRPNRYPRLDDISKIFFLRHEDALRTIHYHSKKAENLFVQLMALTEFLRGEFDAIQLNIPWPSSAEMWSYKLRYPDKKLILQINSEALEIVGHSEVKMAHRIDAYYAQGLIDYIVLDESGGKGTLSDPVKTKNYIRAIERHTGNWPKQFRPNIVVAGGLNSGNIADILKPVSEEFPGISTDIETGVRNEGDHLDLNLVEDYISEGFEILKPKAYFKNLSL